MKNLCMSEISEVFDEWAKELKMPVRDIMFTRSENNVITIYTDRPGIFIGKAGCMVEKYKQKFNNLVKKWNKIADIHNSEPNKEFTIEYMPDVEINFIEVTRADFWLHYDPMSEGF